MKAIPKKIHYCWFGGNPLTPIAESCIESWKKYCPEYEIIEWNETNVDIDSSPFMKAAYKDKKWAFVSDYARYKILYENGGVYLDVDVEVIKNLDDLLRYEAYMGFEGNEYVNSGLGFGAMAGDKMLEEILNVYDKLSYEDHKDNPAEISTPIIVTNILSKYGFKKNGELQKVRTMTILPEDYLCPKNPLTRLTNITKNSYSIHHYDASWVDSKEREFIDKLEASSKDVAVRYPDLISIIIPVYNGEEYLAAAIDSAISQTYKNLEVLVIDDGSSDRTEEIARSYGSRIRYIRKPNGGVASALNKGLNSMRGKYFAWLSHDDVYHPEKLEALHAEIANLDKTIAVSDWDIIDENGNFLRHAKLDDRLHTSPKSFLAFDRKTWLNACAMLIPKDLFDHVGLFDETLRTTQDYDMHLRMMEYGASYKIIHKPLFYSRAHANQGSLAIHDDTMTNSDDMHVRIMSKLTKNDFDEYFKNDPEQFEKSYKSFVTNGYVRTPVQMVASALAVYSTESAFLRKIVDRCLLSLNGDAPEEVITSLLNDLAINKEQKPRLMFCSGKWMTGGMERVMSNLFGHLSKKYEIYLVTPSGFKQSDDMIPIPHEINHITIDESLYFDRFEIVGFTLASLLNIDIVVGFLNLNEKQLKLYEHCVNNDIRTVASNHEYYFYPYRSLYAPMRRLALRRKEVYEKLDAVLWLTNFNTAVGRLDASNAYLMPNPNTYEVISSVAGKKSAKNILCVGRFNDHVKRIDRILNVYSLLHKKNSDITLTLVGKIDLEAPSPDTAGRTISQLIDYHGIDRTKINIVGETKDILQYYKCADVLLMTSETEGFPMVVTEAMSQGVPVVCGDIPGIEDVVVDGINGYILSPDDYAGFASKILSIIMNDKDRETLGENAVDYVKQFEGGVIADKWINVLESILKGESVASVDNDHKTIESTIRFQKRLLKELDISLLQSVRMWEGYDFTVIESKKDKIKRLVKAVKRDYESIGPTRTGRKAVKKITKKVQSVLRIR